MAKNKHTRRREFDHMETGVIIPINKKKKYQADRGPAPILAMNAKQAEYIGYLRTHAQIFVLGPAGTGKTWIAASYAADLYRAGVVKKIILTRPNVPCGRSLGFFPGSLEAKFAPWAVPVTDAIRDRLGAAVYDIAVKNGNIEVVPFEVMRGRSWREAFVLLDEAQCDLERDSGLRVALNLIRDRALPVPVVEFCLDDIVRSGLCAMWARAFEGAPIRALQG